MKTTTIGILGGMGPASGVYFAQTLIELNVHATEDSHHPRFILHSDSQVPSRVDAFFAKKSDPVPSIVTALDELASLGATFGVIICNTAHIFFDEISLKTRLPLFNMIQSTASYAAHSSQSKKIGLLATTATVQANLYQRYFDASDLLVITPREDDQALLSASIFHPDYGIKASGNIVSDKARQIIAGVAERMRKRTGVQDLLLGCTELSLAIPTCNWLGFNIIDPVRILAQRCLLEAGVAVQTDSQHQSDGLHAINLPAISNNGI